MGIIPQGGYGWKKINSSFIAHKWLEYENSKSASEIIFEYKTRRGGIYVDGFNPGCVTPSGGPPQPVILEFLGCFFKGVNVASGIGPTLKA